MQIEKSLKSLASVNFPINLWITGDINSGHCDYKSDFVSRKYFLSFTNSKFIKRNNGDWENGKKCLPNYKWFTVIYYSL